MFADWMSQKAFAGTTKMRVVGIIPARYASTRFPGKPLLDICGKPMVVRVYEQAKKVPEFAEVVIATDDARIAEVCERFDIPVVMTSPDCATPWHRAHEVSERVPADFYVTVNGDEPLINPEVISAAIPPNSVPQEKEFGTNIITEMHEPSEVLDPSNIKVVFDDNLHCRYMSRSIAPLPYKSKNFQYYKHVGVVGLNKKMLDFYVNSVPGIFEQIEGIDSLRFADYDKTLQFVYFPNAGTLSVDTENDLEIVRKTFKIPKKNIES